MISIEARAGETDCDNNSVPDIEELAGNDCNANGILDVCDNDTIVAVTDVEGIPLIQSIGYQRGNIDVDGDTAVVGQPANTVLGVGVLGRVQCYQYTPGLGWQWTQTITETEGGHPSAFGDQVIVRGDRLIVTAPGEDSPTTNAGAVYVYRRINGEWQFQQRLGNIQPRGQFGLFAVLEANRLYVSENASSTLNASTRPRVYCFVDRGAGFELEQTIHMGSWVGNIGTFVGTILFNVHNNLMVKIEIQPIETIVEATQNGQSTVILCVVIYEWEAGRWMPRDRIPIGSQSGQVSAIVGSTDCYIEENRIILTPIEQFGDSIAFNRIIILEKDESGWHVAYADPFGISIVPDWIEKSDEGYYVGASEMVITQSGPVFTERPDLGGVYDRSHRSGNWWGVEISNTVNPPTANISRIISDCNSDGVLDECEIATGAPDADLNLVPDACQVDCNNDGIPDESQMELGDCNANGILDVCDVDDLDPDADGVIWADCNGNGTPDACEADCDNNGIPDDCDLDPSDPDGDGLVADDCNANGKPDACDIRGGLVRVAELRPSGGIPEQSYGVSISMDGDLLAVGAPANDVQTGDDDRVYVYRQIGESWTEETIITPDLLPEPLFSFGYWVAVSGNVLVIKGEAPPELNKYYLYTYEFDGATWQYASTVTVASQMIVPRSDVALDGNRMAVSSDHSRSVTIYEYDNGQWTVAQVVSLIETGGIAERITLQDNLLVVGYGANSGQLFRFDGQDWNLIAQSRHIGRTLSTGVYAARPIVSGDLVAFGNRSGYCPTTTGEFPAGSAQLYRLIDDQLMIEDLFYGIEVGDPIGANRFGHATAFVGDRLVAGSPGYLNNVGRIQMFDREGGNWVLRQTIESPASPALQQFGTEMAASGDSLAVVASGLGIPNQPTENDVIYIYSTDRDVDDDGAFDACQPDCNGNELPDSWELARLSIDELVAGLLSDSPTCTLDTNGDGSVNGLDIAGYVSSQLTTP